MKPLVVSLKVVLLAAIAWMPLGVFMNGETLSGNREGGYLSFVDDIPRHALWDFEGEPVKSFFKHDRVFFSVDDQQRLWLHVQTERGGWLHEEHIQSNVISAAVGFDSLLFVTADHTLWKQSIVDSFEGETLSVSLSSVEYVSSDVASVCSGLDHYMFIKTDGSLMGAGYNAGDGRFGYQGEVGNISTPVLISKQVVAASAGHGFGLYVLTDHSLWGMGANSQGQLGLGHTNAVFHPTLVSSNIQTVGAELSCSWFIDQNDALYFTGDGILRPIGIAEGAQYAVVDPSNNGLFENTIFVLMKESNELLIGAIDVSPRYRSWISWGTEVTGITSCNQGVLFTRKGSPLARFWVPSGADLQAPFDHIQPGVSFITSNVEEAIEARMQLDYDHTFQRVLKRAENGAKPVYRFLNVSNGSHVHTLSEPEMIQLENNVNFVKEGVAFYAFETQVDGTVPVHRFYMPTVNGFHYVIGDLRRDDIIENQSVNDYTYEGIAWYAYSFFGK